MGSLIELARFAKSDPAEMYGQPRRKIPGAGLAAATGAGVLGASVYTLRAAKKSPNAAPFLRRKAGKAGLVGAGLLGAGYGIKRLNDAP